MPLVNYVTNTVTAERVTSIATITINLYKLNGGITGAGGKFCFEGSK